MRPRVLGLTNAQLTIVREVAKGLRPEWRDRFLTNLADLLIASDIVTDDSVSCCAMQVAAHMMGDGGPCCE